MRRGGILCGVVCVWACAIGYAQPAAPAAKPAGWRHDFEQAQAEAKRLKRPLVVHFSADWCGPCRRMERDVFRTPEFLRQLDGRFVAVKVDADQRPDLVEQFGVRGLPTDLFIDPDGRVLAQSTGYVGRGDYLSQMARIDARFDAASRTHIARSQAGAPPATLPSRREPLVQNSSSPRVIGLEGYSPISLWNWREWRKGSPEFAAAYRGVTFHMTTAEERRQFAADPEQYVPKLLGCDPVLIAETERAISGSTKFGAYYNGELYLFASAENRDRFKQAPHRFTRTRHAVRVDEIERIERR
jgi:YHS domain-containing protein